MGPCLAVHLWSWALWVFGPALQLKKLGLYHPRTLGVPPGVAPAGGREPELSRRPAAPFLLPGEPDGYESVRAFDDWAHDYHEVVKPFSQPVVDETRALMAPLLPARPRILDPSAGPGHAALQLAADHPEGEVVAADLSRGMVETAFRNAQVAGRRNMAFFQADVARLPDDFAGYFDAIFCCLSFHHYPDGPAAAASFRRALAPGGHCFVADGGPSWFVELARPISVLTDPGFVRHRTGEEFQQLFSDAGFASVYWVEALPGIGITVAST